MKVATKELKNRLSHYLRLVRAGEHLLVTDRDLVVAEIRGVEARSDEAAGLLALEEAGVLTIGTGRAADFVPVRARSRARLSGMVLEDRD